MKLFIDCETSGLKWGSHSPITVASIITDEKLNIVHESLDEIQPLSYATWSDESEAIHKISIDTCKGFKNPYSAAHELLERLESFKVNKFYCHAMSSFGKFRMFDYQMIEGWLRMIDGDASNQLERRWQNLFRRRVYTTIAKTKIYQRTLGIKDQKLSSWANHLGIEFTHHDASHDVQMCLDVYKYQIKQDANHWNNTEKKGEML